jgi:hypothetical protein
MSRCSVSDLAERLLFASLVSAFPPAPLDEVLAHDDRSSKPMVKTKPASLSADLFRVTWFMLNLEPPQI